jgi:predicted DCC family thiol-disulfide oxidoreductase YuxK
VDRCNELAFLPMRAAEAAPLLEAVDEHERFASWHLAMPDGTVVGGGAACVELLRSMSSTRRVAGALARIPQQPLELTYDVVARNRSALGRVVPDRPGPRRFP